MAGTNNSNLPPGFRFHPTDEELIMFYLKNQAISKPCPVSIIPEVDIYKFDPWDLPEKAEFGDNEWYFFTPRDRKYPNGVRPNRAALSGYWKATGTDKAIYSGSKYVGVKKALVFYRGKPPKGIKTDWIMHEYKLSESKSLQSKNNGTMKLDDWVLCRIYLKKNTTRSTDIKAENSRDHISSPVASDNAISEVQDLKLLPRTCSLSHLWEFDYLGSMTSMSQLFNDNLYNATFDNQTIASGQGNVINQDSMMFQVNNQGSVLSNPIYMNNPGFGFQG